MHIRKPFALEAAAGAVNGVRREEARVAKGIEVVVVASVAIRFRARVDRWVDWKLAERITAGTLNKFARHGRHLHARRVILPAPPHRCPMPSTVFEAWRELVAGDTIGGPPPSHATREVRPALRAGKFERAGRCVADYEKEPELTLPR
jgi:hypothetical protein